MALKPVPRFAVLGHPIEHSLSPRIHQLFAAQHGIELSYDKIDVAPTAFGEFWRQGPGRRLAGANVTFPLKHLAYKQMDQCGEHAQEAEAVNTIVRRGEELFGYNTDGVGLLTDLVQNLMLPIGGQRLLLLGAGGAAHGVLGPLLRHQPNELVIANRTLDRADLLLQRFKGSTPICISTLDELDRSGAFDGVINATSIGHGNQAITLPDGLLKSSSWFYDLSYGDAAEPLLNWARMAGCMETHDGLGMLVEQAAESFRHWHSESPHTAPVLESLRQRHAD